MQTRPQHNLSDSSSSIVPHQQLGSATSTGYKGLENLLSPQPIRNSGSQFSQDGLTTRTITPVTNQQNPSLPSFSLDKDGSKTYRTLLWVRDTTCDSSDLDPVPTINSTDQEFIYSDTATLSTMDSSSVTSLSGSQESGPSLSAATRRDLQESLRIEQSMTSAIPEFVKLALADISSMKPLELEDQATSNNPAPWKFQLEVAMELAYHNNEASFFPLLWAALTNDFLCSRDRFFENGAMVVYKPLFLGNSLPFNGKATRPNLPKPFPNLIYGYALNSFSYELANKIRYYHLPIQSNTYFPWLAVESKDKAANTEDAELLCRGDGYAMVRNILKLQKFCDPSFKPDKYSVAFTFTVFDLTITWNVHWAEPIKDSQEYRYYTNRLKVWVTTEEASMEDARNTICKLLVWSLNCRKVEITKLLDSLAVQSEFQ